MTHFPFLACFMCGVSDEDDCDEEAVKKIYISLPSNLEEDEEYAIQKRISFMASKYLDAVVELEEVYPEEGIEEYEELVSRLESMGEAEYVIFPEGWELERASRIEYAAAREYGKKILIEHGEKLQEEMM